MNSTLVEAPSGAETALGVMPSGYQPKPQPQLQQQRPIGLLEIETLIEIYMSQKKKGKVTITTKNSVQYTGIISGRNQKTIFMLVDHNQVEIKKIEVSTFKTHTTTRGIPTLRDYQPG